MQQLVYFFKLTKFYLSQAAFTIYKRNGDSEYSEYNAFSLFVESLIDNRRKWRTVKKYSLAVMHFLDYLYLALEMYELNFSNIKLIYRRYHEYLTCGIYSPDFKVAKIASIKAISPITRESSASAHAGVDAFLKFCTNLTSDREKCRDPRFELEDICDEEIIIYLGMIAPAAIRSNTRTAEVERGRIVVSSNRVATHISLPQKELEPIADHKYFPLGHIMELIRNISAAKECALTALLASSSARSSEGLQLLWEDVNIEKREVYLVEPKSRDNYHDAYRGLSFYEKEKLCWKGRTSKHTLMLEPYKTIFFDALEEVLEGSYSNGNEFIFCSNEGRPLYLYDYSVVLDPFKRAAIPIYQKLRLPLKNLGFHTLRHSYCYFMLNFVQRSRRIGMSPFELMQLTGHSTVKALATYARIDREKIFEEITVAHDYFFDEEGKTEAEYHVMYLERRLEEWKRLVREEQEQRGKVENDKSDK